MAVKNGALFVEEQITSILPQLSANDELVISDDNSTDHTVERIRSFRDNRIRLLVNTSKGLISNFENCISASRGEIIFLADQDDRWNEKKIEIMLRYLKQYDLVISDCTIVDRELAPLKNSYFELNRPGKGLVKNLIKNSYMGCCMAFRRDVIEKALPFPKKLLVHDLWIGLIGDLYFNTIFIKEKLVYHRRHESNASSTSAESTRGIIEKIRYRLFVLKHLVVVHHRIRRGTYKNLIDRPAL